MTDNWFVYIWTHSDRSNIHDLLLQNRKYIHDDDRWQRIGPYSSPDEGRNAWALLGRNSRLLTFQEHFNLRSWGHEFKDSEICMGLRFP